jgi:hypothetical protein
MQKETVASKFKLAVRAWRIRSIKAHSVVARCGTAPKRWSDAEHGSVSISEIGWRRVINIRPLALVLCHARILCVPSYPEVGELAFQNRQHGDRLVKCGG